MLLRGPNCLEFPAKIFRNPITIQNETEKIYKNALELKYVCSAVRPRNYVRHP